MSMFRSKKLDLGCFVNIKIIRDHTKRKVFAEHEPERYETSLSSLSSPLLSFHLSGIPSANPHVQFRQALRYIIRNMSLPQRTRAQAQLQLAQMHCYTRATQIRNRCIEGGKGRGVLRDFKMTR
ncbi:37S ribosomal protein, mitochondrial, partial [Lachnellula willkommii]